MIGLTTPQAAATLAVTVSAAQAGLFDEQIVDAVILVIFATCLIGPLAVRSAGRRLVRARPAEPEEDEGPAPRIGEW